MVLAKVSVWDAAVVKQVEQSCEHLVEQLRELQYQGVQATLLIHVCCNGSPTVEPKTHDFCSVLDQSATSIIHPS